MSPSIGLAEKVLFATFVLVLSKSLATSAKEARNELKTHELIKKIKEGTCGI